MKFLGFFLIIFFALTTRAQNFEREFSLDENASFKIVNFYGRVSVIVREVKSEDDAAENAAAGKAIVAARNARDSDLKIVADAKRIEIIVQPANLKARIDLTLKIPARSKLSIETADGEVRLDGSFESAEVKTETGTIAANVPLDDLKYNFVWTEARPRFLSDVALEEADEKAAGKFVVSGKLGEKPNSKKEREKSGSDAETADENVSVEEKSAADAERQAKRKTKNETRRLKNIKLNFNTARGIILLNVNPNEVPANLIERPLTEAAKAIVRSGDSLLVDAIRRASPKYFGEYARTLPARKALPTLNENRNARSDASSPVKSVVARVSDVNNRAVSGLRKEDFELSERGESREIISVAPATAPFNLVLLLDVSGSVDNYVDFLRKTARNFVNTVGADDRVAIIIFNEDVKTLASLTTDKNRLSESLDTFDAGGGTAFYDALGYTLAETLRPLKGERTAIVVLSDGDDNRSFLAFDSLLGSIQESGALIYPLYVPSGLIAASANSQSDSAIDPLRSRYIALTSKAETEGARLAQISGGVYYPIAQIGDLQKAYDDIVTQLRTAYSITFRSDSAEMRDNRASPRLKVKVRRENSFVKLSSIVEVSEK